MRRLFLALALYAGLMPGPALACCAAHPVQLLSSHDFQVDVPAAAGFRLPKDSTTIKVLVNATGSVASASVYKSSGDHRSDLIALNMARRARYKPASRGCKYIPSVYYYVENWKTDSR